MQAIETKQDGESRDELTARGFAGITLTEGA